MTKASRIRHHTDKFTETAEICERRKLLSHSVVIVVEPPRRSVLYFE